MIENTNPVMKFLWVIQAGRKIKSEEISTKYASIRILEFHGSVKHIDVLIPELMNPNHLIRNSAANAIKAIYDKLDDEGKKITQTKVFEALESSTTMVAKIAVVNSMKNFPINIREDKISPYILTGEADLQFTAIKCISDTQNFEILDNILKAADHHDLILRKAALSTWYTGLKMIEFNDALEYCTPRVHYLIRASYELQTDGLFLKEILANITRTKLPKAKAYPDFIIRYFTELLGKWEYDPDAYHALHAVLVPSYFTFDEPILDDDKPFVIL